MEIVYAHCCGLDIHTKSIVACVIVPDGEGKPTKAIRTFGTMTEEILALSDWLAEQQVSHVAMESTGVYWKPIYNLLEGRFDLLLVNAAHSKTVPGRKTDVRDCEWIADLLRHGLLKASFVPNREQRELRELTRYRQTLVAERAAETNRLQKVLEGANIKLGAVASNVLGKSAREMLDALVAGNENPQELAELAQGRLREKIPQLEKALAGRFRTHQRFLVAQQLAHIDYLDEAIGQVSKEIGERMRPFEEAVAQLDTIPGVARTTAEVLIAQIGPDMAQFPSADHLASWAGMVPGNNESAGKRRSGRIRKGNKVLRSALVEAARAAARTKNTYLNAQYRRLRARRGAKKAAVAVGHTILLIAYSLLKNHCTYQDLGATYFEERDRLAIERRAVAQLRKLDYEVTLKKIGATTPLVGTVHPDAAPIADVA